MVYSNESIFNAVKCMNDKYFLPAIQREFVWRRDQIVSLFDSLMRNYPIGAFLYWDVSEDKKEDFVMYKFIENYITKEGPKYIQTPSVTRNPIANNPEGGDVTLILDGQQRLSSFYLALKGSYTHREGRKWKSNPNAWKKKFLYLNLLSNPEKISDDEARLNYDFEFKEQTPDNSKDEIWFRVGKVLNFEKDWDKDQKTAEIIKNFEWDLTEKEKNYVRHNLNKLYSIIKKERLINYFKVEKNDPDEVLDIFIRTNDGGTVLKKSDMLLSMATANWEREKDEENAREEITRFVDEINKQPNPPNDFDKDFVLKSCLVMSNLPVQYKVKNFTRENLSKIEANWDEIKDSIRKAVKLINRFGINANNLTSQNAVIPIAYYFYKNPDLNLFNDSDESVENRRKINKWFLSVLLNGTFGGYSDNVLTEIRKVLNNLERNDFPLKKINESLGNINKIVGFNEEMIKNYLDQTKGGKKTFFTLSLLHDNIDWGLVQYEQDHIFPASKFSEKKLVNKGFSEQKINKYRDKYNKLANIQLLTEDENKKKQDKTFKKWIKTRDESYLENHLIPKDDELYVFDNFLGFINRREKLIKEKLLDVFE